MDDARRVRHHCDSLLMGVKPEAQNELGVAPLARGQVHTSYLSAVLYMHCQVLKGLGMTL